MSSGTPSGALPARRRAEPLASAFATDTTQEPGCGPAAVATFGINALLGSRMMPVRRKRYFAGRPRTLWGSNVAAVDLCRAATDAAVPFGAGADGTGVGVCCWCTCFARVTPIAKGCGSGEAVGGSGCGRADGGDGRVGGRRALVGRGILRVVILSRRREIRPTGSLRCVSIPRLATCLGWVVAR